MICQSCQSTRLFTFSAKCSDLFSARQTRPGKPDLEWRGYVPPGPLSKPEDCGDYARGILCLDCGQLQGKFPARVLFGQTATRREVQA